MAQSADFSESIRIIREAHADATAILKKWRDLIDAPGNVTLSVKYEDGSIREIELPSIREAINRYLGGIFEQVTLTDGTNTVIIRMTQNGQVELVNADESAAALITQTVTANRIIPRNGRGLAISGTTSLSGGIISSADIHSLSAYNGQIFGASFKGTTIISGETTINGKATIRNADVEDLDAGLLKYHKQVIHWDVESVVDGALNASINSDGLWEGDPAVLERAGFFSTPTWSDCIYVPDPFPYTTAYAKIYLGDTDTIIQPYGLLSEYAPCLAAMWPYKKYKKVGDGVYRLCWLPLVNQIGRISYVRTGNIAATQGVSIHPTLFNDLHMEATATGTTATAASVFALSSYSCRRFIADIESAVSQGTTVTDNLVYPM